MPTKFLMRRLRVSAQRIALMLIALFVLVVVAGNTPVVMAHVLRQDNGVVLELHIPPRDKPLAQEPTTLEFRLLGKQSSALRFADYKTVVRVTAVGQKVMTQNLEPVSAQPQVGRVIVTFPRQAVYNVVVTGTPVGTRGSKFSVTYVVRVAGMVATKGVSRSSVLLLGGAATIILGIGVVWLLSRRKKQPADIRPRA